MYISGNDIIRKLCITNQLFLNIPPITFDSDEIHIILANRTVLLVKLATYFALADSEVGVVKAELFPHYP